MNLRSGALVAGVALASPTLWAAFRDGGATVDTALVHLALALVVALAGATLLERLLGAYQSQRFTAGRNEPTSREGAPGAPRRRASDRDEA